MGLYKNTNGVLSPIAGRGKAEYGASTVRKGTETGIDLAANAATSVYVIFDTPMPDNDYVVELYQIAYFSEFVVADKANTGFRIIVKNTTGNAYTNQVISWKAFKLYTDNEYNDLLDSQKINDASVKETLTPITYTPNYGTKIGDMCYYYKIGSRVFFSLVVEDVASDNQQQFYQLPAGYRPWTNIYTSTFQGKGIYITTNGTVHASSLNGKIYAYLEFNAFR